MTDQLTPEAVKAALDGATPRPWRAHCDEHGYTGEVHGGIGSEHEGCIADWVPDRDANLIAMAPDLAREYLRLKEVEKAAHRMQKAWYDNPTGSSHCSATWEMQAALAAFRAAVEGK